MAVYDHQEQEQLDEIKAWWKQHGNKVLNIALLVTALIAAVLGWRWWQGKQSAEAATLYGQLQVSLERRDTQRGLDIAVELADKYSATVYAGMGAMVVARSQHDSGDIKNAKAQLAWAVENASDAALRDLARLRLAGVLLDEKTYEDALKQVGEPAEKAFTGRFAELRGDILLAQGKPADARTAYQQALVALDAAKLDTESSKTGPVAQREAAYRELVQIKLDALGGKS